MNTWNKIYNKSQNKHTIHEIRDWFDGIIWTNKFWHMIWPSVVCLCFTGPSWLMADCHTSQSLYTAIPVTSTLSVYLGAATGRNCGAMTKRCKYGVFTSYLELVVCTLYCIVSSFENMYRGMYSQAKYIDSSPSRWIVPPLQPMQHNHSFNFGKPELELAISACQRARDKLCLTNPSSNGSLLLRDPVPQSLNK